MPTTARITPDQIEEKLDRVLATYPDAAVATLQIDGRYCPRPAELPLTGHPEPAGRAAFDLVAPTSTHLVIEQYRQLHDRGASIIGVEMADGSPARFALFDTFGHYGVAVMVVLPTDDQSALPSTGIPEPVPQAAPRSGRAKRTDISELLEADEAMLAMFGYTFEEYAAVTVSEMVHPEDLTAAFNVWLDVLTAGHGAVRRARARYRRSDGSWLWIDLTLTNHLDDPDDPHILTEVVDISLEMAALDEVWRKGELLRRLTDALPVGVVELDADRGVVYANDRLEVIAGAGSAASLDVLLGNVLGEDRDVLDQALGEVLGTGGDRDVEVRLRPDPDGPIRYCQLSVRTLRDKGEQIAGALMCVIDVTDNTRMRKELEIRASFDSLTECYNRATVMSHIERAISGSPQGTALVFIDLDGFKDVNDRHGHAAGDEVLRSVADVLRDVVRTDDVIGRLGGDEFIVLCPEVPTSARAVEIGDRLASALSFDLDVDGTTLPVRASTGVAWSDDPTTTADELVAAADQAMYAAKRLGDGEARLAPMGEAAQPPT